MFKVFSSHFDFREISEACLHPCPLLNGELAFISISTTLNTGYISLFDLY